MWSMTEGRLCGDNIYLQVITHLEIKTNNQKHIHITSRYFNTLDKDIHCIKTFQYIKLIAQSVLNQNYCN
jgi:hypothetical protein